MEPRWQVAHSILCWIVSVCSKIFQSLMAKWFQHFKSSFGSWFSPINIFDTMINFNELVHSFPVNCLLKITAQLKFKRGTIFQLFCKLALSSSKPDLCFYVRNCRCETIITGLNGGNKNPSDKFKKIMSLPKFTNYCLMCNMPSTTAI